MRILLALFAAALAFAQSPETAKADSYMEKAAEGEKFMGAVLVARDGKVLYAKGLGSANLELKVPNTPETRFRLGSITKQFTAAAILQLEQAGKLKVEDPMCSYIPNCPDAWKPITIHHLLSHTSGLYNFTNNPDYPKTWMLPSPPLATLEKVRDRPLNFKPGEKFEYSNTGYIALGAIVEKASGHSWAGYLDKFIFTPAGMGASGVDSHDAIIPNRASGYMGAPGNLKNAPYHDMTIPLGGGDILSTALDLVKWDQALHSETLLNKAQKEKLYRPNLSNYAYGWVVGKQFNRDAYQHSGGIHGFTSHITRFPNDKLVAVALSNNSATNCAKIANDLAGIFLGETLSDSKARTPIQLSEQILDRYPGEYELAPGARFVVTRRGAKLFAKLATQPEFEIFAQKENEFFYTVVDAQLSFTIGPGGKATSVTLHQNGRDLPAKRVTE